MSFRKSRTCEPWFYETPDQGRKAHRTAAPAGYYSTVPNATDSPQSGGRQGTIDEHQVARVARSAALSVYGVKDVVGARWYQRLGDVFGFGTHGVKVRTAPALEVSLNVELAPGVPRDSVLSNVADAIKYTVQRDVGQPIATLTLTVNGQ